jgi:hypothetical protein
MKHPSEEISKGCSDDYKSGLRMSLAGLKAAIFAFKVLQSI